MMEPRVASAEEEAVPVWAAQYSWAPDRTSRSTPSSSRTTGLTAVRAAALPVRTVAAATPAWARERASAATPGLLAAVVVVLPPLALLAALGRGGGGAGDIGATGGAGGFGGGNGGNTSTNQEAGGGGGAGFGGAVFVQQGGSLTISGTTTVTGNTALDGGGGAGANGGGTGGSGSVAFNGIFLQGNDANNGGSGTITFAPALGQTQNDADGISDQTGLGGTAGNAGSWSLVKNGAGLLVINASDNNYTGTTSINAGFTEVVGLLGQTTSGDVTVANGAVLGGGGSVKPNVVLSPGGILQPGLAAGIPETLNITGNLTWNGSSGSAMMNFILYPAAAADKVATVGTLTKGGAGTFQFNFQNTGKLGIYALMTFASTTFSASDFSFVNLAPGLIADFSIVSGNTLQLTVALAPTTSTGVTGSPNPVTYGQSETLTATVTSGGGTPTGTVTFTDTTTSTTLGTVAVNGSGQASFSLSTLAASSPNTIQRNLQSFR